MEAQEPLKSLSFYNIYYSLENRCISKLNLAKNFVLPRRGMTAELSLTTHILFHTNTELVRGSLNLACKAKISSIL